MDIEIIEFPVRFQLHGLSSVVHNNCWGEVGLKLMNEMWKLAKNAQLKTTGINHWVYLPDDWMFVGVEVKNGLSPDPLEKQRIRPTPDPLLYASATRPVTS